MFCAMLEILPDWLGCWKRWDIRVIFLVCLMLGILFGWLGYCMRGRLGQGSCVLSFVVLSRWIGWLGHCDCWDMELIFGGDVDGVEAEEPGSKTRRMMPNIENLQERGTGRNELCPYIRDQGCRAQYAI